MQKGVMFFLLAFFLVFPTSLTNVSADLTDETSSVKTNMNYEDYISCFYNELGDGSAKPDSAVFKQAITGFFNLKATHDVESNMLTIIDFSLSSAVERMWVVDISNMKIVHKSLVSHGRNSGELYARQFSNTPSSFQSSLGFYTTGGVYIGKHGKSLILNGMEPGINDNARERAIVMHSADYVSNDFIERYGRLGRSQGCPAIPIFNHEKIISMLSGGSCLFIYHPDVTYHNNTEMLIQDKAYEGMVKFIEESPSLIASFPELSKLVQAS